MNTRSSSAATQPATLRGDPSSKPSAIPNPISTVGLTVVDPPVAVVVTPNAKCPPAAPDDFEPFVFTQVRAELGTAATAVVADDPILVGGDGPTIEETWADDVEDPADLDLAAAVASARSCVKTAGAEMAKDATVCTVSYAKDRKRVVNNFIEALRKEAPKYNRFLKKTSCVPTFFHSDKPVEVVFVMLSDANDKSKRIEKVRILNEMLIDWVAGMKLKRSGKKVFKKWHSPASINVTIRKFLSAAKEYCAWDYTIAEFSFEGGFNAFFSKLCEKRQREDVSFVTNQNECYF